MDVRLPEEDAWSRLSAQNIIEIESKQTNNAVTRAGVGDEEGRRMRKVLLLSGDETGQENLVVVEEDSPPSSPPSRSNQA